MCRTRFTRVLELGLDTRSSETACHGATPTCTTDFRFDNHSTYGNNKLPGIPRRSIAVSLNNKFANKTCVALTTEHSPSRYAVDMSNTLYADLAIHCGASNWDNVH